MLQAEIWRTRNSESFSQSETSPVHNEALELLGMPTSKSSGVVKVADDGSRIAAQPSDGTAREANTTQPSDGSARAVDTKERTTRGEGNAPERPAQQADQGTREAPAPPNFDELVQRLGPKPNFGDLQNSYPMLINAIDEQMRATDRMSANVPAGSLPHAQWVLNELWKPSYDVRQQIERDPQNLNREDGERVQRLLNDHSQGRRNDPKTGEDVEAALDKYSERDPRVRNTREQINETLNGRYRDDYRAYQERFIPFADSVSAQRQHTGEMINVVRNQIFDATDVPDDQKLQRVNMLHHLNERAIRSAIGR